MQQCKTRGSFGFSYPAPSPGHKPSVPANAERRGREGCPGHVQSARPGSRHIHRSCQNLKRFYTPAYASLGTG